MPAIFTILVICGLIFPIVFLLGITHDVSSAIASIGFGIASLLVLGILFGQKVSKLLNCSSAVRRIHDRVSGGNKANGKYEDRNAHGPAYMDEYTRLQTDEERFDYCRKQILEWQGRMLAVNADRSSDTSDRNSSRSRNSSDKMSSNAPAQNPGVAESGSLTSVQTYSKEKDLVLTEP
jgi:hypothetical protein